MTEDELRQLYPRCFNDHRRPLMLGIHKPLGLTYPSEVLAAWTSHPLYLRNCLAEGAKRIDLDGNNTSEVTFAEKERAWFLLHDLRNQIFRQRSERLHNPIRANQLPLSPAEAAAEVRRSLPAMPKRGTHWQ